MIKFYRKPIIYSSTLCEILSEHQFSNIQSTSITV